MYDKALVIGKLKKAATLWSNLVILAVWSLAVQKMGFLALLLSNMSSTIGEPWLAIISGSLAMAFFTFAYKAFLEPTWSDIKQNLSSLVGASA